MQLPENLQLAIERTIGGFGINHLIAAREDLSDRYRQGTQKQSMMDSDAHRIAYTLTRMPATFAAIMKVFTAINEQAPDLQIKQIIDLGAGPGTVAWAANECFPELEIMTLIERDPALIEMGKKFMEDSENSLLKSSIWQAADLKQPLNLEEQDLVVFSYSIGELPPEMISSLIDQAWVLAKKALVIIEPGTPVGFERVRLIRNRLLKLDAHLLAPCPHQGICPMTGEDWCHFSARVERSSSHRLLKGGTLNYEDEKFSYIVATKEKYLSPRSRVLRHPLHRSGHTILTLCTPKGVQRPTISKKTKEAYKEAKKTDWGSIFSSNF